MWRRSARVIGAAAALTANAWTSGAQAPLQVIRERVLSIDMRIDPKPIAVQTGTTGPAGVAWRVDVKTRSPQGGGMDDIRVHVVLDAPLGAGRTLRVLDASGTVVDEFRGTESPARREFWSRSVPDGVAAVELTRSAAGQAPGATVSYAFRIIPLEQQAITEPNQLMSLTDAPRRFRTLGKSVARLRFMIPGEGQATCTAFVVGPRLVLTNQHCITSDQERESALVDFNYDFDDSPTPGIKVQSIVAQDAGLDYSLLKLEGDPPSGVGRLHFAPAGWKWTDPHALLIVQHPSGLPKKVSIADCKLAGVDRVGVTRGDRSDFGHLCDTLGGSSGSPVMDSDTGLVVGLHHFGFVEGSNDPVNQAVVYARVLADILRKDKTAHAEVARPRPE